MSRVLARLLLGVAETSDPVGEFEHLIIGLGDFNLTENDFIELWRVCSEFLNDKEGSFGSLVTLLIIEKLLRQVEAKDRAFWRELFFESDRKTRIRILKSLLSEKKEEYADDVAQRMATALFAILDAIKKLKRRADFIREAAVTLEKRYNLVGNMLQELNDDALIALKA